jgi:chaperonin GroES
MKAVSDRLIVAPEKPKANIGGVIIPENLIEKPMRGVVVSAGSDCRGVKTGDEILFLKGHGLVFNEGGNELLVLREADVLGVFSETELTDDICKLIRIHKKMKLNS